MQDFSKKNRQSIETLNRKQNNPVFFICSLIEKGDSVPWRFSRFSVIWQKVG